MNDKFPQEYGKALSPKVKYAAAGPTPPVGYIVVSHSLRNGWRLEPPRARDREVHQSLADAHDLRSTLQGVFDARRHGPGTRPNFYVAHLFPDGSVNPIGNDGGEYDFHLVPHERNSLGRMRGREFYPFASGDRHNWPGTPRPPDGGEWQSVAHLRTEHRDRDRHLVHMAALTDWGTPLARELTPGTWGRDVDPFRKAALAGRDFVPFLALADRLDEMGVGSRAAWVIRLAHQKYEDRHG